MRKALLLVAATALPLAGGCDWLDRMFILQGGYLLHGYDAVATPGENITLTARLQKGSFLDDQKNREIRFYHGGRLLGSARTDGDGFARIPYTPAAAGDYQIALKCVPKAHRPEELCDGLLVACRPADAPLLVVDLDHTLVDAGMKDVLRGDPPPLTDSIRVVNRLAQDFTVIYLSQRLDYLVRRSKQWLAARGFPAGPIFLSDVHDIFGGSGPYKEKMLADIRRRLKGPGLGVGDLASDARAYAKNDLLPFLVLRVQQPDNAWALRDQARRLDRLAKGAQVVRNWGELERAVYEHAQYPPGDAQRWLRQMADAVARGCFAKRPWPATAASGPSR